MQPANWENAAAERMVKLQIENRDVRDARVLEVMRRVQRHLFVPPGSRSVAYEDHPVSISHGQTISQPYMVAFMTQAQTQAVKISFWRPQDQVYSRDITGTVWLDDVTLRPAVTSAPVVKQARTR